MLGRVKQRHSPKAEIGPKLTLAPGLYTGTGLARPLFVIFFFSSFFSSSSFLGGTGSSRGSSLFAASISVTL